MDPQRGLAVFRMGAPTAEDWAAHFADLDEVATWSRKLGVRAAIIVVPSATFELPDAKRRNELAQRTTQPGYDPFVAILHPNGVARGILTMLQWMRGDAAASQRAFSSEDEALSWLEQNRVGVIAELRSMLGETRGSARGSRPD